MHRHLRRSFIVISFALLACNRADAGSERAASVERDSAGVRIVEHALATMLSSPGAATWMVADEANVIVGGHLHEQDGQDIHRVTGAALLDDGSLLVGVGTEPEVRIYDAGGRFIRRIGRQGGGPGEFRHIAGPWRVEGGRFVVFDSRQQRLTMLDTAGTVLGMNNVLTGSAGQPTLAQGVGGTNDGRILAMHRTLPGPSATTITGLYRPDIFYALLDTTEFVAGIAGPLPGQEVFVGRPDLEGRQIIGVPPFGLEPLATACGEHVAIADNARFEVELRDDSGSLHTIVRADITGHLIADADFRTFLTSRFGSEATITEARLDALREMTVRNHYPVIGQLSCDTSGNLFVEEYLRPGAESRHIMSFSPDGMLRGMAELPAAHRLLGVHNDALILLTTNELGIESVEVRELLGG